MSETSRSAGTGEGDAFREELLPILNRIRAALLEGFFEVGIADPGATSIGRALGLQKTLSWMIGKLATEPTPMARVRYMPGRQGIAAVVESMKEAGVSARRTTEVAAAFDAYEEHVKLHLGSRRLVEAVVGEAGGEMPQIPDLVRKRAYESACAVWGIHAKVQVGAEFFAPSRNAGKLNTVGFGGLVDLQRLRPGFPWVVARRHQTWKARTKAAPFAPLDPSLEDPTGAPLLTAFSHPEGLDVQVDEGDDGTQLVKLAVGEVGRAGRSTCLLGTKSLVEVSTMIPAEPMDMGMQLTLTTPVEEVVLELYVHRSIDVVKAPVPQLVSRLQTVPDAPGTTLSPRLPLPIEVTRMDLDKGFHGLFSHRSHGELVRRCMDWAGEEFGAEAWKLEDFSCYRMKLTHAPIPTVLQAAFQATW